MVTFALIHGTGDVGWYWHLVAAELRDRGHHAVAPDLPCENDAAGLWEYADAVVDAIRGPEVVVVAHSFGAFTGPLVCERMPVELLVLVIGLRLGRARVRIRARHCAVGRVRRARSTRVGRVLAQSPRAGRRLRRGPA
jgi:pimeloyl-ACP methyl ester carboxylesterase